MKGKPSSMTDHEKMKEVLRIKDEAPLTLGHVVFTPLNYGISAVGGAVLYDRRAG